MPLFWPLIRSCVEGGICPMGTIVTCRPCAANRPSLWAMYRPAESMAGNASMTMFVFSSLSLGAPPEPPEHPAASIMIATADAMSTLRDFILLQQTLRRRWRPRDRLGEHRDRRRPSNCITEHHNVPHRPSHAKRYDLSESGVTPSSALT